MEISIFDNMEMCTELEVARLLPLVSVQRQSQALKFKFPFGRFACLKAYEMLMKMLPDIPSTIPFDYTPEGKPYFAAYPKVFFSISHCRRAIVVVVDDKPVGVDVESDRNVGDALIARTMNREEVDAIKASDSPEWKFLEYWTKKEAVLKLRGTGIVDDMHSVLDGKELLETYECKDKGYIYTLARS